MGVATFQYQGTNLNMYQIIIACSLHLIQSFLSSEIFTKLFRIKEHFTRFPEMIQTIWLTALLAIANESTPKEQNISKRK